MKKWQRFVAGVVSSKNVFEIGNQLVCFKITEKDWIFIAFERRRRNVEGMSGFKPLLANFSNWCPLVFRSLLSYLVFLLVRNRLFKGKSHVRLLEALKT